MLPLVVSVVALFSCSDDNNSDGNKTQELVSIGETVSKSGAYTVEILASDTLSEGYNKIYIDIKEESSGSKINEAALKLHPLMHMMNKVHAAPVENPDLLVNEKGYFEGAIVFIMPGNPDEGWSLMVAMDIAGNIDTAKFDIPLVKNLEEPKKINIVSAIDSAVYFLSLVEPAEPTVGVNDLEFTVHYKQNMMNFPPVEDLIIEIEPEMPSMDHGSPNNVNPVHVSDGHYKGKINFTMTGWWRVNITVTKDGQTITDVAYLDITF